MATQRSSALPPPGPPTAEQSALPPTAIPVVLASPRDPPVEEALTLPPTAMTVLDELWFAGACEWPLASQSRPITIIRTLVTSPLEIVRQRPLRVNVTPLDPEPSVSFPASISAAATRSVESGSEARTVECVTPLASAAEPSRLAMATVGLSLGAGVPLDDSVVDTDSDDGDADERMLDEISGSVAAWAAFWSLRRLMTIGEPPSPLPVLDDGPVRSCVGETGVAWSGIGATVVGGVAASSVVDAVLEVSAGASAATVVVGVLSAATSSVGVAWASSAVAGPAPSVSRQNPTSRPRSATHRRGLTTSDLGVSRTLFRTCS